MKLVLSFKLTSYVQSTKRCMDSSILQKMTLQIVILMPFSKVIFNQDYPLIKYQIKILTFKGNFNFQIT
jgi:hypothetical protein